MLASALHCAADWAKSVFSSAQLGDPRRTARLVNVATQLAKHSGKSITHSSEGREAMQEGAYRFIRNPNISAEALRKTGAMRTVELAQAFPELLAIEDTTSSRIIWSGWCHSSRLWQCGYYSSGKASRLLKN